MGKLRKNVNGNGILVLPMNETKKIDFNKDYFCTIEGPIYKVEKSEIKRGKALKAIISIQNSEACVSF